MRSGSIPGSARNKVKRGATDGLHLLDFAKQGHGPGQHRVRPAEEHLASVVIHRQCHIAMCGQIVGTTPLIVVEADPSCPISTASQGPLAVRPR